MYLNQGLDGCISQLELSIYLYLTRILTRSIHFNIILKTYPNGISCNYIDGLFTKLEDSDIVCHVSDCYTLAGGMILCL